MKHCKHLLFLVLFSTQTLQVRALTKDNARTIFAKLNEVFCARKAPPELHFPDDLNEVFYQPTLNRVMLGLPFLSFLDGFGKDAQPTLALILAHELAHHYGNHGLQMPVGEENSALRLAEIQADNDAIFYAHLAGYSTSSIEEKLLNELYAKLNISERGSSHYLKKEDRLAVFKKARQEMSGLLQLFEAGNLLLVLGENANAADCFVTISNRFSSPELYNNAGVAFARAAFALTDEDTQKLILPFTFHENAGLAITRDLLRSDRGEGIDELRLNYLLSAKNYLEMALTCSADFRSARSNLAAVYLLLKHENQPQQEEYQLGMDYQLALLNAKKASNGAENRNLTAFFKAAEAYLNKDQAQAKRLFQDLATKGDAMARINLEKINGTTANPKIGKQLSSNIFEKIRDLAPYDPLDRKKIMKSLAGIPSFVLRGADYESDIKIAAAENNSYTLVLRQTIMEDFSTQENLKYAQVYVLSSGPQPNGNTAGGLKTGDSFEKMQQIYGIPSDIIESTQRMYCVYPMQGLVVVLETDRVVEWVVFYRSANF
jgi:hypothetical protein